MRQLQEQIDSREFAELMAEERLEPRGVARLEMQFARLMALLANCHRDSKTKAFSWEDFAADFDPQPKKLDVEKVAEMLRAFTLAMGGKVVERGGDNRQPVNHAQGECRADDAGTRQGEPVRQQNGRGYTGLV